MFVKWSDRSVFFFRVCLILHAFKLNKMTFVFPFFFLHFHLALFAVSTLLWTQWCYIKALFRFIAKIHFIVPVNTRVLVFSNRSSRLSQSWTLCLISIVRFCTKAPRQPWHSPLCRSLSWNRLRTTTPLSSTKTSPALARSAAVVRPILGAASHTPPPTPTSPREDCISS